MASAASKLRHLEPEIFFLRCKIDFLFHGKYWLISLEMYFYFTTSPNALQFVILLKNFQLHALGDVLCFHILYGLSASIS